MLDTRHGADYFRRWHRDKANSGGLLVHKATHHFDLVNWLLDSIPEEVFAFGDLKFYGKEAAAARGEKYDYERYTGSTQATDDPFALRLDESDYARTLYLDAEKESGYVRDKNVFGSGITSEDTMGVLARYENGVIMTYSLIAYTPQEGYELYITGDKGRLEVRMQRPPHVLDESLQRVNDVSEKTSLRLLPMFGEPQEIAIPAAEGGHGGGDVLMLQQIFTDENARDGNACSEYANSENANGENANSENPRDALHHQAGFRDGLASLALGIAANHSIASGQPVRVRDLFPFEV
jgi:predicted dehydrogenase